jgi:hypothetical protein
MVLILSECIIFIIVIIFVVTFVRGIHKDAPERNHLFKVYSFAAVIYLQFELHVMLTSHVTCFVLVYQHFPKYVCSAHYGCFCGSLVLYSLIMFLSYFMNDFEMVLVAPVVIDITPVFIFHICCISHVSYSCFKIFSDSFLIKFLSPEIATALNIHVPSLLSQL